jgi:hypothetical protein
MTGQVRPLSIPGAVVIEAAGPADARGSFPEYPPRRVSAVTRAAWPCQDHDGKE